MKNYFQYYFKRVGLWFIVQLEHLKNREFYHSVDDLMKVADKREEKRQQLELEINAFLRWKNSIKKLSEHQRGTLAQRKFAKELGKERMSLTFKNGTASVSRKVA